MNTKNFVKMLLLLVMGSLTTGVLAQEVDRTELPIKGPWYPPIKTLDARDAEAPPVFEVKAPKDAPNVVIILLDDIGFGGTSATGRFYKHPISINLQVRGYFTINFIPRLYVPQQDKL